SIGLFNDVNQPGLSDYAVTPPDATGAIGPNHYVEMVNQDVGVYDRTLGQVSTTDMGTFTGASLVDTVSDPQVQWDGHANRWLYAAVGVSQGDNTLLFGWSKTADPSDLTNGWCRFGIGRGSDLDDYPKLGHDDDFIILGSNVFTDAVPGYKFETATIWAIPKPAAGDTSCTGPSTAWYFADAAHPLLNQDGSAAYTPVPANTVDASSAGYVVAAHTPLSGDNGYLGPQTALDMWHVVPNGGSPGLVADGGLAVPSFDIPGSAPQPGSSFTLDTLDARLTQAVAVNDPGAGGAKGVWTQHTVAGAGGRSVVRWYELLGGPTPSVRQQGEVSSATDFVFNAAISPAIGGDSAAIFYNRSSSTLLPVIGGLSRGPSTPLGTMEAGELLLGTSSAADVDPSCSASTPCRWGDYSGATPDPVNPGVVWGSNQVTGGCFVLCGWFSQWQTRNFAVVASTAPPPPTVPSAPQSLGATAGDGTVSLTWSAPASDGGSSITNYEIYRGTSAGTETKVAEVGNVLAYTDGGRTNGTTYYYEVSAKNAVGEGSLSNEASATPQPPPPTPPSAPTLTAATSGNGQVGLSWTAPSSDGGSQITNYTIYRGTTSGGEVFLATIGNVTSYVDAGLTNGMTYYYTVAAVNVAGTGPMSNELSATPAGGDFTIAASPPSSSVARGGTATYSLILTASGGFTGSVSLSATISPKPRGVSFSFNPSSLTLSDQASSTLTVRTGRNTARGTYTITITAVGGGLTRTTTVTLIVT
ncbi:MAG TPA: fibronectin type III domain-containing protein, partial [Acidimicrobiales bacterium]|nr:fibronectin type III domain-containing protein [Acidimicrobiales bacterium]